MNTFTPFSGSDWSAWAGAEPFLDGSDPLISIVDTTEDGRSAAILLDRNGIEVDFFDNDGRVEAWVMAMENPKLARLIAEGLDLANMDLESLGFEKLNVA